MVWCSVREEIVRYTSAARFFMRRHVMEKPTIHVSKPCFQRPQLAIAIFELQEQ